MPKLTKSLLDELPPCKPGERQLLRDSELKGFGLRITHSAMTFFVEHRVRGKKSPVRLSIGSYPAWPVKEARLQACALIMKMDKGIDPRR